MQATATATEFRKNMFQMLERALNGEAVQVSYHGQIVKLIPEQRPSKLSKLKDLGVVNGSPEEVEAALYQLKAEQVARWESESLS